MVDVHDEGLIGQHGLKDLLKALLPGLVGLLPSQGLGRVLLAGPLDKVIDVLEVVVERHAVDAAVVGDVADGDLVERLLQQQILERLLQRALGEFRHGDLLWVGDDRCGRLLISHPVGAGLCSAPTKSMQDGSCDPSVACGDSSLSAEESLFFFRVSGFGGNVKGGVDREVCYLYNTVIKCMSQVIRW